jgi:hypothetical protein
MTSFYVRLKISYSILKPVQEEFKVPASGNCLFAGGGIGGIGGFSGAGVGLGSA